jgi:hypothetical protein
MFRSPQNTLPNIFFVQTHTQDGFFDVIVRQGDNQEEELQMTETETSDQAPAAGQGTGQRTGQGTGQGPGHEEEEEEEEDQEQNKHISALIAKLHKDQRQNERKDEEVEHLKSQLLGMQTKLEHEIAKRKEVTESFSQYRQLNSNQHKTYEEYQSAVRVEISHLEQTNATLTLQNQEYKKLNDQFKIANEKQIEKYTNYQDQVVDQIQTYGAEIVALKRVNETLKKAIQKETQEKDVFKTENEKIKRQLAALNETYEGLKQRFGDDENLSILQKQLLQTEEAKVDRLQQEIGVIKEEKEAATQEGLRLKQEVERLKGELQNTGETAFDTAKLIRAIHKIFMIVNESPTVTLEASYRRQILNICKEAKKQSSNQPSPASSDTEHKESQKHPVKKHPVAERPPLNSTPHPKPGALQTPRSGSSDEKDSGPRSDVGASAKELSSTSGAKSSRSAGSGAGNGSDIEERLPSDYDGSADSEGDKKTANDGPASNDGSASDEARPEPELVGELGRVYREIRLPGEAESDST